MIEFINRLTGTKMRVPDERKGEYLAAGHRLAANCAKPAKVVIETEPEQPVKKTVKRATKKKK